MIVYVNLQYHQEVAYLYHRSLSLSPQASCEAQEREIFALTALRDPWLIELQSLVEMSMELRHKIRASDRSWTQGKKKPPTCRFC